MPRDPHILVYDGPKTPDSLYGQERYATDPNAASIAGRGNFTNAERGMLALHSKRALLRYKDDAAYFCSACWSVYNVKCPKCSAESEKGHFRPLDSRDDPIFRVEQDSIDRYDGRTWVIIQCRKCDFRFRVIRS